MSGALHLLCDLGWEEIQERLGTPSTCEGAYRALSNQKATVILRRRFQDWHRERS